MHLELFRFYAGTKPRDVLIGYIYSSSFDHEGTHHFLEDSDIEGDEVEEGEEAGAKHAVYGKKIIMTGSKDKLLLARLKKLGADIQPAMTKDTEIVLAKDKEEDTAKAQMGRKLGIIMSIDEFKEKYGL